MNGSSDQTVSARTVAARGIWGVSSQALTSLSNLILAVFVAREVDVVEFGAWSLAYVGYVVALQVSRAICSTPILLTPVTVDPADRRFLGAAVAVGMGIGLLASSIIAFSAVMLDGKLDSTAGFVVIMPVLIVQDVVRHIFFRRGEAKWAALIDFVWLAGQIGGFAFLAHEGLGGAVSGTVAWGLAALLSVACAMYGGRVLPRVSGIRDFARATRGMSARLMIDTALSAASTQVLPFILALTAGLAAAGALRAGFTLLGGIAMLVMGLTPVATVEAMRYLKRQPSGARIVLYWSIGIGVLSSLYGLVLISLPNSVGEGLIGDSWHSAEPILIPLILQSVLRGPYTGVPIVLRARLMIQEALELRVLSTLPALALPLAGAAVGGVTGAAWGLVISTLVIDFVSVVALTRYERRPTKGSKANPVIY